MNTPNIVVSEPGGFPEEALALLGQMGRVTFCEPGRDALVSALANADVLWIRLAHRIDADLIASAPNLKAIVTPTTGLNHIDGDEARRRGIEILSLRGKTSFLKNIRATAEHTIGLMLALMRQIPAASAHVENGGWNRDLFQGAELHEKTVGLFGYGRLGKIVARYLEAFEANVLVTDPKVPFGPLGEGIESVDPGVVLERSDLVSLHVDLREDTRDFFDASLFRKMKKRAYFINTSRGELVDEQALLDGLKSGALRGAALDVLCDENSRGMDGHPLVEFAKHNSNLIITPHIGGCTAESMRNTENFMARELHGLLLAWAGKEALASAF